jgi:hypothetical protein
MPTQYQIRTKEYNFRAAPDLTGREDAAYVPLLVDHMLTSDPDFPSTLREGPRFGRALDAAIEAARMCDEALRAGLIQDRCAFVECVHEGPRPPGAMKGYAYVSYRPLRR